MKNRLLLPFLTTLLLCPSLRANDCTGFDESTVEEYNHTDMIVAGVILEMRNSDKKHFIWIKVKVLERFKNVPPADTIEILTCVNDVFEELEDKDEPHKQGWFSSFNCLGIGGHPRLMPGIPWIFWTLRDNESNQVAYICSRSAPYSIDKDSFYFKRLIELSKAKGYHTWVNEYGHTIAKGKLKNQYPVGAWEYYDTKGSLTGKGKYKNNSKHGLWKQWRYGKYRWQEYEKGIPVIN